MRFTKVNLVIEFLPSINEMIDFFRFALADAPVLQMVCCSQCSLFSSRDEPCRKCIIEEDGILDSRFMAVSAEWSPIVGKLPQDCSHSSTSTNNILKISFDPEEIT